MARNAAFEATVVVQDAATARQQMGFRKPYVIEARDGVVEHTARLLRERGDMNTAACLPITRAHPHQERENPVILGSRDQARHHHGQLRHGERGIRHEFQRLWRWRVQCELPPLGVVHRPCFQRRHAVAIPEFGREEDPGRIETFELPHERLQLRPTFAVYGERAEGKAVVDRHHSDADAIDERDPLVDREESARILAQLLGADTESAPQVVRPSITQPHRLLGGQAFLRQKQRMLEQRLDLSHIFAPELAAQQSDELRARTLPVRRATLVEPGVHGHREPRPVCRSPSHPRACMIVQSNPA